MSKRVKIKEDKVKIIEIVSIFIVILFAVATYIFSNFIFKSEKNNIAIYVGDKEVKEVDGKKIDINVDGTFVIGDMNGDYNIIEIKNKVVSCIDANCPDKICVKHGALHKDLDNDIIVCAPHRLSIYYK